MDLYSKIFKFVLLTAILSLGTQSLWSQSKSIKLNGSVGYDQETRESYIGRLAPVLILENANKGLHQFEINRFQISSFNDFRQDSSVFNGTSGNVDVAFRYQYSTPLAKNAEKVIPYIGLSGRTGISYDVNAPFVSNEFYAEVFEVYATFGVVPSLRFRADKKVFIDLELPLEFIKIDYTSNRIDNPAIPLRQQRTSTLSMEVNRPSLQLRAGIGIKI